jgi:DNA-binding NarL/FixJ family response regulator
MQALPRPRILIADDHEGMARHLADLLRSRFEVLAPVRDGRIVLDAVTTLRPDVVLLDVSLPHVNGLEALRAIRRFDSTIKILVVTMFADAALAQEALARGASGFVLKGDIGRELFDAIAAVLRGHTYLAPGVRSDVELLAGRSMTS